MRNKAQITVLFLILLVIIVGITLYSVRNQEQLSLQREEEKIKRESYITGLLDVYNRDMAACFSGIQQSEIENKEEAINTSCIEPINDSRTAKLLKQWGYESELVTVESTE